MARRGCSTFLHPLPLPVTRYVVFIVFVATAISLIVGFGSEMHRAAIAEDAERARVAAATIARAAAALREARAAKEAAAAAASALREAEAENLKLASAPLDGPRPGTPDPALSTAAEGRLAASAAPASSTRARTSPTVPWLSPAAGDDDGTAGDDSVAGATKPSRSRSKTRSKKAKKKRGQGGGSGSRGGGVTSDDSPARVSPSSSSQAGPHAPGDRDQGEIPGGDGSVALSIKPPTSRVPRPDGSIAGSASIPHGSAVGGAHNATVVPVLHAAIVRDEPELASKGIQPPLPHTASGDDEDSDYAGPEAGNASGRSLADDVPTAATPPRRPPLALRRVAILPNPSGLMPDAAESDEDEAVIAGASGRSLVRRSPRPAATAASHWSSPRVSIEDQLRTAPPPSPLPRLRPVNSTPAMRGPGSTLASPGDASGLELAQGGAKDAKVAPVKPVMMAWGRSPPRVVPSGLPWQLPPQQQGIPSASLAFNGPVQSEPDSDTDGPRIGSPIARPANAAPHTASSAMRRHGRPVVGTLRRAAPVTAIPGSRSGGAGSLLNAGSPPRSSAEKELLAFLQLSGAGALVVGPDAAAEQQHVPVSHPAGVGSPLWQGSPFHVRQTAGPRAAASHGSPGGEIVETVADAIPRARRPSTAPGDARPESY